MQSDNTKLDLCSERVNFQHNQNLQNLALNWRWRSSFRPFSYFVKFVQEENLITNQILSNSTVTAEWFLGMFAMIQRVCMSMYTIEFTEDARLHPLNSATSEQNLV